MSAQASLAVATSSATQPSSQFSSILQGFEAPVSEIVARSMVNSSFSGEDRFDWLPHVGLRVSIPDQHQWVRFPRAPASELRSRLFPFPNVRGHRHKKAPQPPELPERSLAWWFAQLIHYGLPITVDRDQAKESIKFAIKQDRLVVPQRLLGIEGRLKRVYVAAPDIRPGMNAPSLSSQPVTNLSTRTDPQPNRATLRIDVPPVKGQQSTSSQRSFNLDDDSDSSSSDESDTESFRIPEDQRHLFTPYGARITKPAEYPGLREKEERLKRENALRQRLAHKTLKTKQPEHDGSRKVIGRGNSTTVLTHDQDRSSSEDRSEEDGDSNNDKARGEQPSPAVKQAFGISKCVTPKTNKIKLKERAIDLMDSEDKDEDEADSVIFYTPMEFVRRRPEHLDDEEDTASIIVTGSQRTSGSKSKMCVPAGSVHINAKKRPGTNIGSGATDGSKTGTSRTAQTTIRHKDGSSLRKSQSETRCASPERNSSSKKHTVHKSELQGDKDKKVIEISSGSDEDNHNVNQDNAKHKKPFLKPNPTQSTSALAIRSRSASHELTTTLGPSCNNLAVNSVSTERPNDQRHNSTPLAKKSVRSSKQEVKAAKTGVEAQHNSKSSVEDNDAAEQSTSYRKDQQEQASSKKHKKRRKKHSKSSLDLNQQLQLQTQIRQDREESLVHDLTGCGVTEMFGGLHPDDVDVVQGEGPFGDRLRSESPFIKQAPSAPHLPRKSPSLPSQPDENSYDSDWDLPSLTGLFSSQDTPEAWKSKERRRLEARKQRDEIEKSYDPNSVPALREELAALPQYLKTFMRHDSPELTQNWPVEPISNAPQLSNKDEAHHKRSRSKSQAPSSRKRARQSMSEIEAGELTASGSKRVRLASVQPAPMLASIDDPATNISTKRTPSGKITNNPHQEKASKKGKKRISFADEVININDEFDEPYDQRTARHKARSLGPVRKSIER